MYTEETKTGSNASLKSIGQEPFDDVLKHTSNADNRHVTCRESDRETLEQQWQEEKKQGEEDDITKNKILEEEEMYGQEGKRRQEEEERRSHEELEKKRRTEEDNVQRKKQREEEEESRKLEEEPNVLELAENPKLVEECCREEEQKQQEEVSMSERLTSLFGIIRKKKEDLHQDVKEEPPTQAPLSDFSQPVSQPTNSTNLFEDIPLNSDPFGTDRPQKDRISRQVPSGRIFLNRTAKVSAVKPR